MLETMKSKITCFLLYLMLGLSGIAQEQSAPDIITDRPDQTESPSLVAKGYFQIETGFFKEELDHGSFTEKTIAYNTTLLRIGLLNNLEMRIGTDFISNYVKYSGSEMSSKGIVPLMVGAKVGIAEGGGIFPEIALAGHIFLPFAAHKDLRPANTGVDFRFAFTHEISEGSDLSYNLGAEWGGDSSEATYVYTLAYGFDLLENLGLFMEVYGGFPEDSRAQHQWDAGMTYKVRPNLQVDAYFGSGIDAQQELLYGAGLSLRLPN